MKSFITTANIQIYNLLSRWIQNRKSTFFYSWSGDWNWSLATQGRRLQCHCSIWLTRTALAFCSPSPCTYKLQITNITDSRDHQRLWGGRVTWQHFAVWKDKAMSPDSNWEGIVSIWQMKIYTFLSWQNLSCRNNEWKFDSWFNIGQMTCNESRKITL